MGTCKYCGKSTGMFSHSHKECEDKHEVGLNDFTNTVKLFFAGTCDSNDVISARTHLKANAFLSDEDICHISDIEIRQYTASIHRPFSPRQMHLMDDFLNAIGVPFNQVNASGAVDEFTKKLMKGFMVEFFTDQITLPVAQSRCQKVLAKFPMTQANIDDAYLYVLNKAASNFLKNGLISDDEQQKLDEYIHTLALPLTNLPAKYQDSDISKISQVAIIKSVQRGVVPRSNIVAPILLGKNETILWTYNGVSLYQEKITREWVGRSGGFSFRIMKGVYYRTGASKGHPVEHSSMEFQGQGSLYITNKNLIFYSPSKSAKIPFSKIIGLTPYSDGIEVHKDGANQKRMTMQGFDPWFLMNLLSQINNL